MACAFCEKTVTVRIGGEAVDPNGCLDPGSAAECPMMHSVVVEVDGGERIHFGELSISDRWAYMNRRSALQGPRVVCSFCQKGGLACDSAAAASLCLYAPPYVAAVEAGCCEEVLAAKAQQRGV